MDRKILNRLEARANIIKAMAHSTRLFIINRLEEGECCVCELTELIGADMSTVSKHLSVLRNAGIINSEKRGTQIFYSLKCPCVLRFFDCIEKVIESNADEQKRLMK